ncbi:ATP-binding protein [Protofrankia coriariae]|nr:ATP-binding protein [Protofrankia coriariae]ONH34162.1 hypothetical protein BL254_17805 [Protofrankia sp. BMG5.30]
MTAALAPATFPEPTRFVLMSLQHVWHYPAHVRSVGTARQNVMAQLQRWGLDGLTDVAIVVSELVTNATRAGHRAHQHNDSHSVARVAVRLTYSHHDVIVEVWDGDTGQPTRRDADPNAEDGRGLHLVSALTRDTGYYWVRVRTADGGYRTNGKVVWAVIAHDTPPISAVVTDVPGSAGLPRRSPQADGDVSSADPIVHDHTLLQRVIDGLRALDDWMQRPAADRTDTHTRPAAPTETQATPA